MARYHELDALRAVAMLLGVVLHAFLFLIPIGWVGQDPWAKSVPIEQNPYVYLLALIHGFRMPVFFLLSGFFTAMLWQRRGLSELAAHRLKRIGLPLLIGAFTIVPLNALIFTSDKRIWSGEEFQPIWWLFAWLGGFSHLWFLWMLLWLAAAFIGAAKLGVKFGHPVVWWLAVPLTLLPQLLMHEPTFGPDTSDELIPHPVVLFYYALFFVVGAMLYQRGVRMRREWAFALIPALLVAFPVGIVTLGEDLPDAARAVSHVMQTAYAWLMCFGMIGLFKLVASKERYWVRYMSDASYWLYLWHLPLVAASQLLVLGWPINVHLKFVLIFAAAVAILLVVYQLGVRYTWVGTMLNGPRSRRGAASA